MRALVGREYEVTFVKRNKVTAVDRITVTASSRFEAELEAAAYLGGRYKVVKVKEK